MTKTKTYVTLFLLTLISLSFLSLCSGQVVGSGSIDTGLVAYWRLDETSGNTVADSSGNGLTSTATNPTWTANSIYNNGLSVNSSNNGRVALSSNLASHMSYSEGTFTGWVRMDAVNNNSDRIISNSGGAGTRFYIGVYEGKLWYRLGDLSDVVCSTPLTVGTWYFISLIWYSNGSSRMFLNTIADSTLQSGYLFNGVGDYYYLGCISTGTSQIDASFDDFRIYNRSLSLSEINTLYNGYSVEVTYDAGSTVTPNGTVTVGVDQSQTFQVNSADGYAAWTYYLDDLPYAPSSSITLSGVQADHTLYFTSQYVGGETSTTDDTPTSTILAFIVVLALIFGNILLLLIPSALMRFVFGVVSLSICGLALTYDLPFSPYLQLVGLLVSVLGMLAAARVRD